VWGGTPQKCDGVLDMLDKKKSIWVSKIFLNIFSKIYLPSNTIGFVDTFYPTLIQHLSNITYHHVVPDVSVCGEYIYRKLYGGTIDKLYFDRCIVWYICFFS